MHKASRRFCNDGQGRSQSCGRSSLSITSGICTHSLSGWQKQTADDFAQTMEGG